MTKQECAVVMAYTGSCMLTGDDLFIFYKYVEKLIGRPIFTHELPELSNEIKSRAKSDFIMLCKTAKE